MQRPHAPSVWKENSTADVNSHQGRRSPVRFVTSSGWQSGVEGKLFSYRCHIFSFLSATFISFPTRFSFHSHFCARILLVLHPFTPILWFKFNQNGVDSPDGRRRRLFALFTPLSPSTSCLLILPYISVQ